MATVKDFKITKNVNSKKILKDIENVLNELGINGEYELDIKDITAEDTIIKPLYSIGIDIHKKIPEKKRVEIMDTVGKFLRENYGVNFTVYVLTD